MFARYWAEALRDPAADADKNEAVSALEAFHYAQRKTTEFFDTQKRLATEHAVLEDTGKGEGERDPKAENGAGQAGRRVPAGAPRRERRRGARSRTSARCSTRRSRSRTPSTS